MKLTTHLDLLRRSKILPVALCFTLALLGGIALTSRALDLTGPWLTINDYTPDYVSARAWVDGGDPYAPVNQLIERYIGNGTPYYAVSPPNQINAHPPSVILFHVPLALLPFTTARWLWLILSAGAAVLAVFLLLRELGMGRRPALALGIGALALPPIQQDLGLGQINSILMLLLVYAWIALKRGRSFAGVPIGLAATLKIFPILLLIPLIKQGHRHHARTAMLAAGVTSLIGVFVLGFEGTATFIAGGREDVAYWRSAPANTSLYALPFRWLSPSTWRSDAPDTGIIAPVLALALVAICIAFVISGRSKLALDPFWSAVPWIVLATPLSWQTNLVLVLPLLIVAAARLWDSGLRPPPLLIIAITFIVIRLPGTLEWRPDQIDIATWILGYGLPTIGLLLFGLLDAFTTQGPAERIGPPPMDAQGYGSLPISEEDGTRTAPDGSFVPHGTR